MTDTYDDPQREIARIESEILAFEDELRRCQAKIRHLMDSEDLDAGVTFAQQIFAVRQDKLRLDVEIQLRRNAANRLRRAL
ncbi:hypothetical protein JCM15519_12380 [Fundidesulfovibrio butyratiphilus]